MYSRPFPCVLSFRVELCKGFLHVCQIVSLNVEPLPTQIWLREEALRRGNVVVPYLVYNSYSFFRSVERW